MKNWLLLPLVLLFSWQSFATTTNDTESFAFLSHAQFMQLTDSEQIEYVKGLKKILAEMSTQSEYFANEMSGKESFYSLLWNANMGAAIGADPVKKTNTSADYEKAMLNALNNAGVVNTALEKVDDKTPEKQKFLGTAYQEAADWLVYAQLLANDIKDDSKARLALKKKIQEGEYKRFKKLESKAKKYVPNAKRFEVAENYYNTASPENSSVAISTTQLKDFPGAKPIPVAEIFKQSEALAKGGGKTVTAAPAAPTAATDSARDNHLAIQGDGKGAKPATTTAGPPVPAPASKSDTKPAAPAPAPAAPPEAKPAAPAPASKPEATTAETKNPEFFRCMHSGFVVKKPDCVGTRKLPTPLEGLAEPFECPSGTVMCNPLIFGYKSPCDSDKDKGGTCFQTISPLCVAARGIDITARCAKESDNEAGHKSAVDVIKKNPSAFNQLSEDFKSLCSTKVLDINPFVKNYKNGKPRPKSSFNYVKRDIMSTCAKAAERVNLLKEKYLNPADAKAAAPTEAPKGTKSDKK